MDHSTRRQGSSRYTLKRKLKDVQENCSLFFRNLEKRQKINSDEISSSNCSSASDQENIVDVASIILENIGFRTHNEQPDNEDNLELLNGGRFTEDFSSSECDESSSESSDDDMSLEDDVDDTSPLQSSKKNIRLEILLWCLKYDIKNKPLSEILEILRTHGHKLPKDSRTLKQTPRDIKTKEVHPGIYWHFGVKAVLDIYLDAGVIMPLKLTLDLNIDGLPPFRSSHAELWPLLGKFQELPKMKPFIIGIYYDHHSKPEDIHAFLEDFVEEMIQFRTMKHKEITVTPGFFIMDAPANAAMKLIICPNGKKSCPNCMTVGVRVGGRMSFPSSIGEKRTDSSFRNREDPLHHTSYPGEIGPLEKLEIDMIKNFPPDYLHVCCLGTMKKKLLMLTSKLKIPMDPCRGRIFAKTNLVGILQATGVCQSSQPSEINRSIRLLSDVCHFKGTEFRHFMIYYGIVVLKDNVDMMIYKNYVYLHCAMTICLSDHYRHFLPLAKELFIQFVEDYKIIYGSCMVTFVIHRMLHLTEAVEKYGSLENYSAFQYESRLGVLKNSLKSGNNVLQQAANRSVERLHVDAIVFKDNLKKGMIFFVSYY